jgi:hypothetical protein
MEEEDEMAAGFENFELKKKQQLVCLAGLFGTRRF